MSHYQGASELLEGMSCINTNPIALLNGFFFLHGIEPETEEYLSRVHICSPVTGHETTADRISSRPCLQTSESRAIYSARKEDRNTAADK